MKNNNNNNNNNQEGESMGFLALRAWHKEDKYMTEFRLTDIQADCYENYAWLEIESKRTRFITIKGEEYEIPESSGGANKVLTWDAVELSQYVGLKDKNNAKIYTGDYIECQFQYDDREIFPNPPALIEGIVILKNGCYGVKLSQQSKIKLEELARASYDFVPLFAATNILKTPFNIYRNPELLNGGNNV